MDMRNLGDTGIRVSPIALGCWQFAGDATWGPQDRRASIATVHAAFESGVTFFDSAEMYGAGLSEEILGEALRGRRDRTVIATKVHRTPMTGRAIREACEASLRRLQTDFVDLYQIHYWDRNVPVEECVQALLSLRKEGKIRAIGVSNSGTRDLSEMMLHAPPATNQMPYSLLWRAIEFEIQPLCVSKGIGILAYSPLAQGLLSGTFRSPDEVPEGRARTRLFSRDRPQTRHGEPGREELAFAAVARIRALCAEASIPMTQASLAWLMDRPAIVAAVVGARTPAQIRENASSMFLALPAPLSTELTMITDALKNSLGSNPDPWQADSRAR
jgi:myo-inositol catabolism protein IolS